MGSDMPRPQWLRYEKFKRPSQFVLARIECTEEQRRDEEDKLKFLREFCCDEWVQAGAEMLEREPYWDALLNVNVSKRMLLKTTLQRHGDPLSEYRVNVNMRLCLMSTLDEMATRMYPLPGYEAKVPLGLPPIRASRPYYAQPKPDSPIFVIDCEMCVTELNPSELTRITMLNEAGDVVLDTFVRPRTPITDYLTCYSGITAELLEGVTTTLEDVQEAIARILPPSAILAGHSLENDLRALRLSHPYCIDVALGFTMTNRRVRTSLRGLMYYYFDERIQTSTNGHCSYQDAWAALRLLKLKMDNGYNFGDIANGFDYVKWGLERKMTDCVQLFQHSQSRDFAKELAVEIKSAKPIKIGECAACKAPFMSQCANVTCMCRTRCARHCCACVARDVKHEESEANAAFNFGKAIFVSQSHTPRPPLRQLLNNYQRKRVLVAKYLGDEDALCALKARRLDVYDMCKYESVEEVGKHVFDAHLMANDLCLLEFDARTKSLDDINAYVRAAHARLGRTAIMGVLMCAPEKAILYLGVKA